MRSRLLHLGVVSAVAVLTLSVTTLNPVGAAASATYGVQLDAPPPAGEPWSFLRLFPGNGVEVHQGDVIESTSASTEAPHTATFVPSDDPNAWRADNQGPGGPWATIEPDQLAGGDDDELVFNPAVAFPSDPSCGAQGNPCTFDGNGVTNSGLINPDPGNPPSTFTEVTAPVGTYSLLCLLHPGMQTLIKVVEPGQKIPSPGQVQQKVEKQVAAAVTNDGPVADAFAQRVSVGNIGDGHVRWTIDAGGFFKNVSANEFVNSGLTVHTGDEVRVQGNFEIHTATLPAGAVSTVPFVIPRCERTGKDGHPPCKNPANFQLTLNNKAINPAHSNTLKDPSLFRNSGLLPDPSLSYTFSAVKPGTYTMVCLVHGPEMSTVITVEK